MSCIVLSIFLLSIGASFIQRTTGFGFGIFALTRIEDHILRRILSVVVPEEPKVEPKQPAKPSRPAKKRPRIK